MKEQNQTLEQLIDFFSKSIRDKDDTIYRQRCIVGALCIIITMLLIK